MVVSINFCGIQRTLTKTNSVEMPLAQKTRVTDVLEFLKDRYPELPLDESSFLVTVNQEVSTLQRVLHPYDSVSFLPHIGGG